VFPCFSSVRALWGVLSVRTSVRVNETRERQEGRIGRAQIAFTISEIYYETIRNDNIHELSDTVLRLSKFINKAEMFCPPGALQSRKWRHFCTEQNVSCSLTDPNVRNGFSDIIRQNLEPIHLLSHPFILFPNSSVRQVVCVKGKLFAAVCIDATGIKT
jgi:hypothetical protein